MDKSAIQWLDDLGNLNERIAHDARLRLGGLTVVDSWMAPQLLATLDDVDERRRFWSIVGLSCLARNNALGAEAADVCRGLIDVATSDPAFGNRQAALIALGHCPAYADVSVPAIVGIGRAEGHALVRAEAIRTLTALGPAAASAAAFLISALDDRDRSIAWQASLALKFVPFSDPMHVHAVIDAAEAHRDPSVRSQLEAAVALHGFERPGVR
jgi:hypothetical protein